MHRGLVQKEAFLPGLLSVLNVCHVLGTLFVHVYTCDPPETILFIEH